MKKESDLRRRRKELRMSIRAVAAKAGISAASVRAMETGLFQGKLMTRQKIAGALGIPLRDLMTPEERRATEGPRVKAQAQFFEDVSPLKKIETLCKEKEMSPEEAYKILKNWKWLKARGRG